MKGLLIHLEVIPTKTHDLSYLNKLLIPVCTEWDWLVEELRFLTRTAVTIRYPGETATREDAEQAFARASSLRDKLLTLLK